MYTIRTAWMTPGRKRKRVRRMDRRKSCEHPRLIKTGSGGQRIASRSRTRYLGDAPIQQRIRGESGRDELAFFADDMQILEEMTNGRPADSYEYQQS